METINYRGFGIETDYDNDPINPREDDNLGTMVCSHKRYNLGDIYDYEPNYSDNWRDHIAEYFFDNHFDKMENFFLEKFKDLSSEEYEELIDDFAYDWKVKENLVSAIWEYIDNNVVLFHLSLYDHGGLTMRMGKASGWDCGQVGFIYALKGEEGFSDEEIEKVLKMEVGIYDQYLRGEVYRVTLLNEEGEMIESFDGVLDRDNAVEDMKRYADMEIRAAMSKRLKRLKGMIKAGVNIQYRQEELDRIQSV